jgi:hypothetical protein
VSRKVLQPVAAFTFAGYIDDLNWNMARKCHESLCLLINTVSIVISTKFYFVQ